MVELVGDCPRCDAKRITFDLLNVVKIRQEHGWQNWYESFCCCRHCKKSTIFVLSERGRTYEYIHTKGLMNITGAVNSYVEIQGFINIKDMAEIAPPEYLPKNIEAIFNEGSVCMSIGCNNAAGTMFRLCVDLVTKEILPVEEVNGLNLKVRKNLGLRLPWLFDNRYLPEGLREVSHCIKEDGNDGAHDGTLSPEDVKDLFDFTFILLERIYTEPKKLQLAQERRKQRRGES